MDSSQQYQPLSHALNPPLAAPPSRSPYSSSSVYTPPPQPAPIPPVRQQQGMQDDLDDDDQEDDDEGIVEGQLDVNNHERREAAPASPPRTSFANNGLEPSIQIVHDSGQNTEKRRPGRPRGSKNRKPRAPPGSKQAAAEQQGQASGPPPHPDINPANQQYYEFQWRVLNLCTEFYGAAEELVKGTNPLVIAQCYHMGPGAKLDPLVMLNEAKRICDTLLANPSQLVANPPPPMYPPLPTLYSSGTAPPAPSSAVASTSTAAAPVITNAQSFVVPLSGQAPGYVAATPQYPVFATPGQYATTPYYQYPYGPPPPGYYPAQQQQPQAPPQAAQPVASTSTQGTPAPVPAPAPAPVATTVSVSTGSTSGAWTDGETERLRRLAEESKAGTANGEVDWENVIRNFGDSRSRHQILIKATSMGLKESSTRVPKRRRENDATQQHQQDAASGGVSAAATQTASPAQPHEHSATPQASPAMQNLQRPASSSNTTPAPGATASAIPWPMPTVAMNTASPLLPSSSSSSSLAGAAEQPRASYYRPRPTDGGAQANKQVNHYSLFNANGHTRGDGR